MALVDVLNMQGEKVSEMDLADDIFGVAAKPGVLHEVVTMQLANRRSGNACVKNRSDVKASGKKMYRQKGTGRARRGERSSPLMHGGGSVFGPHPKSWAYKVPKKVRRKALCMALSSKMAGKCLKVVDKLEFAAPKTKDFVGVMRALGTTSVLIVTQGKEANLELSSRNVPGIKVLRSEGLNVYDVLKYRDLILLEPAVREIEGRLSA